MINLFSKRSFKDKKFKKIIKGILGKKPGNPALYLLALRHSSVGKDSNERLEFLGDAVLGAIVGDYLFKKFPYKDEGFLTEIRSRIVKRETLNGLAVKIGLNKIIQYQSNQKKNTNSHKSIYGNALEAFIGAIYLDKGYQFCSKFVIKKLIQPFIDIDSVISTNTNFKSILIEWAQKHNKDIRFDIINETGDNHSKVFTAQVHIENEAIGTGQGASKKKAEQAAAEKSCKMLELS